MKKIIITVILLGMICLLPMNTEAMVKVTEKGNEIAPSPAPDEVTTLMAPDEGATETVPMKLIMIFLLI